MSAVGQDLQFAWRMARRRPLVSLVALLSLVVGMSATTVVFGLLNAVAFRSLPVDAPGDLRLVLERRDSGLNHSFSYQDYLDLRAGQRTFTDLAAYSSVRATQSQSQGSDLVDGEIVSGSFFPMLGVAMHLGRGLTEIDDRPSAGDTVVVGESLWRRRYGDRRALDVEPIVLNGRPFTIVGVAAAPFRGMQVGRDAQFWAPLRQQPVLRPMNGLDLLARPTASWLTLLGRTRAAITPDDHAADLNRVERTLPVTPQRTRERTFVVAPGHQGDSMLPAATASPLQLLLVAAGLVLVVACANVAGLLLARATEREREFALRTALGASAARLTRLLMAEAALLGLGATALALGLSIVLTRLAVPLLSRFGDTVVLDVSLDWRMLGFAAVIGLGATTLFGLVPVIASLRQTIAPALADTGRGSTGRAGAVLRRALVSTQFALSLALVFVALLLVRTLVNLQTQPTGMAMDEVALLAVDPEAAQYAPDRVAQYLATARARLQAQPGVHAVGHALVEPLDFGGARRTIDIPGYTPAPDEDMEINYNRVGGDYFEAIGLRPRDGRVFDDRDRAGTPLVMVINEAMAARFWRGTRAVGRDVRLSDTQTATVIGVVPDAKYRRLRESAAPSFYLAAAQFRPGPGTFHVRVDRPDTQLEPLRRVLAAVDPAVPVTRARTLRQQAAVNVRDERLAMTIAAALAGAAVLLAAVGLYAAMAYAVGQRSREIGVRLALGAVPGDVRRLVLRQGLGLALAGGALGAGVGVLLARALEQRLFGVAPLDGVTMLASLLGISVIAALATWTPARRASRVDPVDALRTD